MESMIYIMSNCDQDELHMRAAVCLRGMCSVSDDATKIFAQEEEEEEIELTVEEGGLRPTNKKKEKEDTGDPKYALQVLAGYTNTKHYDDMNEATKKELLDDVAHNQKWRDEENNSIETSTKELVAARAQLVVEQKSTDPIEEDDEEAHSGSVEIQILGEEEEEKEEKKEEKEKPPPPLVKKQERIDRYGFIHDFLSFAIHSRVLLFEISFV